MPAPVTDPVLGVDIGSRTTKIVQLAGGRVVHSEIFPTTHDPMARVGEAVARLDHSGIATTGYGRHLMKVRLETPVITEIKACALGARFIDPDCGLVIDVGGQDSKVVETTPDGGFRRFEVNDRCAAGTGRFLEVMAETLGYGIEEMWRESLTADRPAVINSMCTVFAESEVISLIAAGEDRRRIALGVQHSIINRLSPLIARFEPDDGVMAVGGVALNGCIIRLLAEKLGREVSVPADPQIVPAIGAALHAARLTRRSG